MMLQAAKPYLYGIVILAILAFIYWYSDTLKQSGENECKADAAEIQQRIDAAVADVRAEETERVQIIIRAANADKRRLENDISRYRKQPEVSSWLNQSVPGQLAASIWLRRDQE